MIGFDIEQEIQDLAEDLDKYGYITDFDTNDVDNRTLIVNKIMCGYYDDIFDWLNNEFEPDGDNMIINGMISRLSVIQKMSDQGEFVLSLLVDSLPQVQVGSADSYEYSYYSDEEENCICVKTEKEAEVIADMLEALSRNSGCDTNFGTNEPEPDGRFEGFWTVYQVD